jgi:hypothetical protein
MTVYDAAVAAANAIDASQEEAIAIATSSVRPGFAGSPLWFALPPSAAPSATAPLAELVEWCAGAVAVRDVAALGEVVGLIHEVYAAHGWAIAAAQAAAGARALPDVAEAVAQRARDAFVVETAALVAACAPDLAALVAIAAEPPAGDLVRGVLAKTIEVFAAASPVPSYPEATLDEIAELFATALPPAPPEPESDRDLDDLLVCIHDLGRHEWSWDHVDEWTTGDPLIIAKAVARGRGFTELVVSLEQIRLDVAEHVTERVAATWREAVERVKRTAVITTASPLADAIAGLADDAAVRAATRLATTAHAQWTGRGDEDLVTVCAELLGDPRDISTLWEAHAPAIRAALERA